MHKSEMDPEITILIGRVIERDRRRRGYNQTALAPMIGLDQSALSRVESGKQQLTATQWFELCRIFDYDPGKDRFEIIRRYLAMKPVLKRMLLAQQSLSKDRARAKRTDSQRTARSKTKGK